MKEQVLQIPKVDDWKPLPEDIIFTNAKGLILAPVAKTLQVESGGLDYFIMNSKKCYNSQTMRDHTCNYLNYFEKYYDTDHELLLVLFRIKYLIDTTPQYLQEDFVRDEVVYIINNPRLRDKARAMVDNNYQLSLAYKNIPEALKYTDEHAKLMLCMSLFMNFCIPLITHYAYIHKIGIIDDFIMQTFDYILYMYPQVDIYNKLFATTYSNVTKSELKNAPIWAQQDIRGKDNITHSYASVSNIILNIMPKYTYDRSIISLNFTSIAKNTSKPYIYYRNNKY
jgi:hypothetical protein